MLIHKGLEIKNKWKKNVSRTTDSLRSTVTRVLTSWHFPWWNHVLLGRPQLAGLETWSGWRTRIDWSHNTDTCCQVPQRTGIKNHMPVTIYYFTVKNETTNWLGYLCWPDQWIISVPEKLVYNPEATQWAWKWEKGARYTVRMSVASGWLPTEDIGVHLPSGPRLLGQCLDGWTFSNEASNAGSLIQLCWLTGNEMNSVESLPSV